MAFPVALALGVIDLIKMLFAKKKAVNDAADFLIQAGTDIEAFKTARKKIDSSADQIRAQADPLKQEAVVLEPAEVVALDDFFDHASKALQVVGQKVGI